MADRPTYWELLQHPLWQKKRLEILERADWQCENCGDKDTTLQVHHSYYERGYAPWQYPSDSLHCLCRPCHEKEQDWMTMLKRRIGLLPLGNAAIVLGFVVALDHEQNIDLHDIPIQVLSFEFAMGMAYYFDTNPGFIRDNLTDGVIDVVTLRSKLADWHEQKQTRVGRDG